AELHRYRPSGFLLVSVFCLPDLGVGLRWCGCQILLSAVLAGASGLACASGPAGAGHVSGLAGTGDPFSVDDLVVGEDRGSLLAHHLTDLVEDEADLLLGT